MRKWSAIAVYYIGVETLAAAIGKLTTMGLLALVGAAGFGAESGAGPDGNSLIVEEQLAAPAQPLYAVDAGGEKVIFLTFDDGPEPKITPRLLEELEKHRIRATFFPVGQKAAEHPEITKDIAAAGHAIGLHSHSHSRIGNASPADFWADFDAARGVLAKLRVPTLPLFRPPYGVLSPQNAAALQAAGVRTAFWSVDTQDYNPRQHSASAIAARVRANLAPGAVFLLHDGGGNGNREGTIGAIAAIAQAAREAGYRFGTLAESLPTP